MYSVKVIYKFPLSSLSFLAGSHQNLSSSTVSHISSSSNALSLTALLKYYLLSAPRTSQIQSPYFNYTHPHCLRSNHLPHKPKCLKLMEPTMAVTMAEPKPLVLILVCFLPTDFHICATAYSLTSLREITVSFSSGNTNISLGRVWGVFRMC